MTEPTLVVLLKLSLLIEPVATSQNLELVDIEWRRESVGWVLRLYIDKEGGIGVDACAQLSREISLLLDVEDMIEQAYTLEVSSPGINRPIKKAKDFERFVGKKVKIKTLNPIENRKNFKGILKKFEKGLITVSIDNSEVTISLEEVEKARLDII